MGDYNSNYSSDYSCELFGKNITRPPDADTRDTLTPYQAYTFASVQLTICLLGIMGNIISLVVLGKTKSLQTIPNVYIGHLAVTDLFVCLLIPVNVAQLLVDDSGREKIPDALCKTIGILIVKNTSSTLMAMMMIACNRYILIVRGRALYDKVYTKRNTALSIVAIWLWLLIVAVIIPEAGQMAEFGYNEKFGVCLIRSYCYKNYMYTLIILASLVFLPVSITTGVAYIGIVRKLVRVRRKLYETSPQKPLKRLKRQIKNNDQNCLKTEAIDSGVEVSQHYEEFKPAGADNFTSPSRHSDSESDMDFVDNDENGEHLGQEMHKDGTLESRVTKRATPHRVSEDRELMSSIEEQEPANCSADHAENTPTDRAVQKETNVDDELNSPTNRRRSKSFLRRMSPANIRVRSATFIARLRKPNWKKHALAIANMITIYVVMWVCWSPMILIYIIDKPGMVHTYVYKIAVTLMYLNSAFNVLLYALMNNSHRKALLVLLTKCRKRCKTG